MLPVSSRLWIALARPALVLKSFTPVHAAEIILTVFRKYQIQNSFSVFFSSRSNRPGRARAGQRDLRWPGRGPRDQQRHRGPSGQDHRQHHGATKRR